MTKFFNVFLLNFVILSIHTRVEAVLFGPSTLDKRNFEIEDSEFNEFENLPRPLRSYQNRATGRLPKITRNYYETVSDPFVQLSPCNIYDSQHPVNGLSGLDAIQDIANVGQPMAISDWQDGPLDFRSLMAKWKKWNLMESPKSIGNSDRYSRPARYLDYTNSQMPFNEGKLRRKSFHDKTPQGAQNVTTTTTNTPTTITATTTTTTTTATTTTTTTTATTPTTTTTATATTTTATDTTATTSTTTATATATTAAATTTTIATATATITTTTTPKQVAEKSLSTETNNLDEYSGREKRSGKSVKRRRFFEPLHRSRNLEIPRDDPLLEYSRVRRFLDHKRAKKHIRMTSTLEAKEAAMSRVLDPNLNSDGILEPHVRKRRGLHTKKRYLRVKRRHP